MRRFGPVRVALAGTWAVMLEMPGGGGILGRILRYSGEGCYVGTWGRMDRIIG